MDTLEPESDHEDRSC